jgi:Clp protease
MLHEAPPSASVDLLPNQPQPTIYGIGEEAEAAYGWASQLSHGQDGLYAAQHAPRGLATRATLRAPPGGGLGPGRQAIPPLPADRQFTGAPEGVPAQSRHQQELLWKLYGHLAWRTGGPAEEIAEDIRRGRYLDAREALDYGLIDEIAGGR